MSKWLVEQALKFRFLVLALAALVLGFGLTQLRQMPVDALPEFGQPTLEIQTEALGLSAVEVEELVTINVEELVIQSPWLESIDSQSLPGVSRILMTFEPGTDLMRARQAVQERLAGSWALPNVGKPPVLMQPVSAARRAMMVGLSSKTMSPIEMSVLARWTIVPRLMGVRGVSNVTVWAQRNRQLHVQVDPERLRSHKVELDDVVKASGDALWVSPLSFLNASMPGTGGWLETPNQRLAIRHILPISTPEQLAEVPVENESGMAVRLGDVATVVEGHPPLIGEAVLDAGPGLLMVVEKLPDANALDVVRDVEAALGALQAGLPGVDIDASLYRSSNYIEASRANITPLAVAGFALGALALGLLAFSLRAVLIGTVAMAVSVIAAVGVLYFSSETFTIMTMAGIAAALLAIVDDAVMGASALLRRARGGSVPAAQAQAADMVSVGNARPIGAATLVALLAVVPLFFMSEQVSTLLSPMMTAFALALIASLLASLTITPVLGSLLFGPGSRAPRSAAIETAIGRHGHAWVAEALQSPRAVWIGAGIVAAFAIAILPMLRPTLLPAFKERDILIQGAGAPGSSITATRRLMGKMVEELRSIDGVKSVGAQIGRAVTGDTVVGSDGAQIWVNITAEADYEATRAAISEAVAGYPGFTSTTETYLGDVGKALLPSTAEPILVRIFGQDLDILSAKAEEVRQVIGRAPGVVAPRVVHPIEEPHVSVKVDLEKAARAGLKPGDVRRVAATIFAGIEVGNLFENQKVFDVVVWGTPEARNSLDSVKSLLIDTPSGGHVRLADVADIHIASAPTVIQREGVSRYIDVRAAASGRDLGQVLAEVRSRIQQIEFPLEYHPEVVEQPGTGQGVVLRLLIASLVGALAVLLVLQAAFGSWRLATLGMAGIAAGILGGLLGAFASGGIVSLGSIAGLLGVTALAARNTLTMIDGCQRLDVTTTSGMDPALVLQATGERLMPMLTASAVAGAIFLPFAVLGGGTGLEVLHPMALVVLGGIFASLLFSLFVLPVMSARLSIARQIEALA